MNRWLQEYRENPKERIPPRKTALILPEYLHHLLPFIDNFEDEFTSVGGRVKIGIAIIDQAAWKIIKKENLKTSKSDTGVWFVVLEYV